MKNIIFISTAILIVIILSSCARDTSDFWDVKPGDIFIVGTQKHLNGQEIASVWKNGQRKSLTDARTKAYAYDVFIEGSDVYIVGTVEKPGTKFHFTPFLWKNGVATQIDTGNESAIIRSIFVEDGNVYMYGIVGYIDSLSVSIYLRTGEFFGDTPVKSKYWINGEAFELTYENQNAVISALAVRNGDVYIAGFIEVEDDSRHQVENRTSILWKNGQPTVVPDAFFIYSIFLVNEDVYLKGIPITDNIRYDLGAWKNGDRVTIFDKLYSRFTSRIFINEDGIYVIGNTSRMGDLKVWKDDELLFEIENTSKRAHFPSKMIVHNEDIYIVGVSAGIINLTNARFWKNGERERMKLGLRDSIARSIAVVK
jgi:hypothetical protein